MGSRDGARLGHPINSWKGLVTFCKRTEFRLVYEIDCADQHAGFACKVTKREIHGFAVRLQAENREFRSRVR